MAFSLVDFLEKDFFHKMLIIEQVRGGGMELDASTLSVQEGLLGEMTY